MFEAWAISSPRNNAQRSEYNRRNYLSRLSISARLGIGYTVAAFAMLLVVTAIMYWILIRAMEWDEKQLVLDKVKMFEKTLLSNGDHRAILENEIYLEGGSYWPDQHYVVYSRIIDEKGNTIIETPGMSQLIPSTAFPEPVDHNENQDLSGVHYHEASNGAGYYLFSSIGRSGGYNGPPRIIQVAMDETGQRRAIAIYRRNTILALFFGTLAFSLVSIFVARYALRPLRDLAAQTERITATNTLAKVSADASRWPTELTVLANSFYQMLDRINTAYQQLLQCTEDMAHELRSPINRMMGEAEVALSKARTEEEYRTILESNLEECVRLSRMIKECLFIAGAENPHNAIRFARLDVGGELDAVCEFHEAQAQEKAIRLVSEADGSVDADQLLFRRAVSNLISNALANTPEGGEIRLSASEDRDSGTVEVVIADNGYGICEADLPRVFDRFFRKGRHGCDVESAGSGLGLAIVKSIMSLHGGSVAIDSTPGRGTSIRLNFPEHPATNRIDGESLQESDTSIAVS